MKKPKTYFQKYNSKGREAGREAISASHPVLKELIAIINEQQNNHYVEKQEVDLFKYNTIWIPTELYNRILPKYYVKNYGKDTVKKVTFYVGDRPWRINFKREEEREKDIENIKIEFEKKLAEDKRIKEAKEKEDVQPK